MWLSVVCSCDWDFTCLACAGTPLDDRWPWLEDTREQEQERREAQISRPDFLRPGGTGA